MIFVASFSWSVINCISRVTNKIKMSVHSESNIINWLILAYEMSNLIIEVTQKFYTYRTNIYLQDWTVIEIRCRGSFFIN